MIPLPKPEKKPKAKKKRKKSDRQKVKERLIEDFSKFIRLRDSDENGTGSCVTCGKLLHWKEAHAGHFVRCGKETLRFSEQNVHFQCSTCNTYNEGERWKFGKFLDEKFGAGFADDLERRGEEIRKWTLEELRALREHYRAEVKRLLAGKTLED